MVSRDGQFVPVATFGCASEAHLAKHLLESEGIAVFLEGVETGGALNGLTGLGDHVRLQVPQENAGRAAMLLADAQARTELPEDWEEQAAASAWACTLCGQPVPDGAAACPSCDTPCDGIRAAGRRSEDVRTPSPKQAAPDGIRTEAGPSAKPREEAAARPGCLGALLGLWWMW